MTVIIDYHFLTTMKQFTIMSTDGLWRLAASDSGPAYDLVNAASNQWCMMWLMTATNLSLDSLPQLIAVVDFALLATEKWILDRSPAEQSSLDDECPNERPIFVGSTTNFGAVTSKCCLNCSMMCSGTHLCNGAKKRNLVDWCSD